MTRDFFLHPLIRKGIVFLATALFVITIASADVAAQSTCPRCQGSPPPALLVTVPVEEQGMSLREVRDYIRENNLSWTAGYTSMSNVSSPPHGYEGRYGTILTRASGITNALGSGSTSSDTAELPESFDWRNNHGDWTTPVKNQSLCGSCWAFAATGAFESYWEIVNDDPNLDPDFSEQYLVSCNKDGWSCEGGTQSALKYLVVTPGASGGVGTVLETDFPYESKNGAGIPCRDLSSFRRFKANEGTTWQFIEDMKGIPSQDKIKNAIYTYGPVVAAMHMSEEISRYYRSGIIEEPASFTSEPVNHEILIVGWGHDPVKNKGYWICKNSYDTYWGEKGWFRIYFNNYYIGTDAAYFSFTDTRPGSISVSSNPTGAKVILDSVDTGQLTNTLVTGVAGGYHSILLRMEGFGDYATTVYVHPGNTRAVHAALVRNELPEISVRSVPDKAGIRIDGLDTGKVTNTTISVLPGVHTLALERTGYITATREVVVSGGSTTGELFILEPRNPTPIPTTTVTATVTTPRPTVTVTPSTTPGVVIGAWPREGRPPARVQFSDLTQGDRTGWFWAFGDGTFSEEENPLHTYAEEGEYPVKLTVQTSSGTFSAEKSHWIILRSDLPPAPEPTAVPTRSPSPSPTPTPAIQPTATPAATGPLNAEFTASPRTGQMPLEVSFADTSTGSPSRWSWAFGDGTFSDEKNPVHSYSEPGEYGIRLTVQGGGATSTLEKAAYILVKGL
jgi:PKD repeat protein/C1A family cysteine protease